MLFFVLRPQEPFLIQLRRRARTPEGRTVLRSELRSSIDSPPSTTAKETALATRGLRKDPFDLRRYAAFDNLSVVDPGRRVA